MSSTTEHTNRDRTFLGFLCGLIALMLIALPLSASVAFATHPATRSLFGERLSESTAGGFQAFWWIVAALCAAVPFLVGFGVARLSGKTLGVIAAIVAVFVVAVMVLGQMYAF